MNIYVCIKQVPDTETKIKLNADSPRIYPGMESMIAMIEYDSVWGKICFTMIPRSDTPMALAARTNSLCFNERHIPRITRARPAQPRNDIMKIIEK